MTLRQAGRTRIDTTDLRPHETCSICRGLRDEEYAAQKWGWEENDTHLPAACNELELVRDLSGCSSRKLQLQQCPECRTYYLYRSDYEFLVNGSEDEEWLTRLTDEGAQAYLA